MAEHIRNQNMTHIKVGLFTIVAIFLLTLGYGWFRDWFISNRYTSIKVHFRNAGNIERGNPVTIFGVKRGRVDKVSITRQGVLLDLLVHLEFPLPLDTRYVITDSNLMGSRQLDIIPGILDLYPDADYIAKGESLTGISSLVPKIDDVIGNMNRFIIKLAEQEEWLGTVREMLVLIDNVVEKVDSIFSDNFDTINETIVSVNDTAKTLSSMLHENRQPLNETIVSASKAFESIDFTLQEFDKALASLELLSELIDNREGTLYKLMGDDTLYESLVRSTAHADSLLKDIRNNPGRYFRIRFF